MWYYLVLGSLRKHERAKPLTAWSVLNEESNPALCLTKWWFICCSVTVPCPGSEATLHGEPRAGLSPVLSCSGLRVHPGFFQPDTALCLQPRVHSGDTRASPCPVWVFISRVCIGASLQCSGGSSNSCCCPRGF